MWPYIKMQRGLSLYNKAYAFRWFNSFAKCQCMALHLMGGQFPALVELSMSGERATKLIKVKREREKIVYAKKLTQRFMSRLVHICLVCDARLGIHGAAVRMKGRPLSFLRASGTSTWPGPKIGYSPSKTRSWGAAFNLGYICGSPVKRSSVATCAQFLLIYSKKWWRGIQGCNMANIASEIWLNEHLVRGMKRTL